MRFSFEVGRGEPHRVDFYWGQMFGTLEIKVDKRTVIEQKAALFSPTSFFTPLDAPADEKLDFGFFQVQLVEKWSFEVGIFEKHTVRIEKRRARWLAGLRPHQYRVFIDDEFYEEYEGY